MTAVPIVTIDGPAGAGKSTLGRGLALRLGLPLVDTGLFYRAQTVAADEAGIGPGEEERAAGLARRVAVTIGTDPRDPRDGGWARVDGRDVTARLRDPALAGLLAFVAQVPGVRAAILEPQRGLAGAGAVVLGRDTGTVVFPAAACKLYLDASPAERAARRRRQLLRDGATVSDATLAEEVAGRDREDQGRAVAPLRVPPGAVVIDTEASPPAEVLEMALAACRARGLALADRA
ncbi:MAG TPA: (d)CMP kinase [Candidatus Dormibacteraeota bacterium]|nr:(d)CMP kinase [Candidatus Dormibacteraeota bacterium]